VAACLRSPGNATAADLWEPGGDDEGVAVVEGTDADHGGLIDSANGFEIEDGGVVRALRTQAGTRR